MTGGAASAWGGWPAGPCGPRAGPLPVAGGVGHGGHGGGGTWRGVYHKRPGCVMCLELRGVGVQCV